MTRQERDYAWERRKAGDTWEQIAKTLSYAPETVRADMISYIRRDRKEPNVVYPTLRRIISENFDGSVGAFAGACGVARSTLYSVLSGAVMPGKSVIDAILRYTGLTYEEAFRL